VRRRYGKDWLASQFLGVPIRPGRDLGVRCGIVTAQIACRSGSSGSRGRGEVRLAGSRRRRAGTKPNRCQQPAQRSPTPGRNRSRCMSRPRGCDRTPRAARQNSSIPPGACHNRGTVRSHSRSGEAVQPGRHNPGNSSLRPAARPEGKGRCSTVISYYGRPKIRRRRREKSAKTGIRRSGKCDLPALQQCR
jgi:hypothetical protein